MSFHLEEIALGAEGLEYTRRNLAGWHALSTALHGVVCEGQVATFLPSNIPNEDLHCFEEGGKLPAIAGAYDGSNIVPIPNADHVLAQKIESFVAATPGRICIMENALATSDDPSTGTLSDILLCEGRVYHVVDSTFNRERILASIRDARAIPSFVGALTVPPDNFRPVTGQSREIELADIRYMAERAEQVFVGAYDGESFLLWTK